MSSRDWPSAEVSIRFTDGRWQVHALGYSWDLDEAPDLYRKATNGWRRYWQFVPNEWWTIGYVEQARDGVLVIPDGKPGLLVVPGEKSQ